LIPLFYKRDPTIEKPGNGQKKKRKMGLESNDRNNSVIKAQREGIPIKSKE